MSSQKRSFFYVQLEFLVWNVIYFSQVSTKLESAGFEHVLRKNWMAADLIGSD